MFDIMKDLKENIQKNNIKKLVLSVVLGMFCYCINNAMKEEDEKEEENKKINAVLIEMLKSQTVINEARGAIKEYREKIYIQIQEEGKVTKRKVINFIRNQYTLMEEEKKKENVEEEGPQEEKEIEGDIKILEQYFHLENKEDEYECTEDNFTEIFWDKAEGINEDGGIEKNGLPKIILYFTTIVKAEKTISQLFQEYYNVKKNEKKNEKKKTKEEAK